jgi:REP element-mobilizing transposase RayT
MRRMKTHAHLGRLRDVWARQPVYFITTCTAGRRPLLANPTAHGIMEAEWRTMSARRGWSVGRYVIMPDHVHFFVTPAGAEAEPLSVAIGAWKQWSAYALRRVETFAGPLWQREFFDHVLRTGESRGEKWHYMRENPVRAGLVARAEDWPYAGVIDYD